MFCPFLCDFPRSEEVFSLPKYGEHPKNGQSNVVGLAGGRAAGPWLGAVKRYLEGLVVDGDLAPGDVERAEQLAREFLAGSEG